MPTWSKRRACHMGSSSNYSSCRSTPGTWPTGRSRHRSRGFRNASHPRRSASSMPTLLNPDPEVSCSSHRAADEASHLYDVCPRTGALRLSAGYWFAGSIPVPASTENLRDRLAPAGVSDVGAARKRQCRKRTLQRALMRRSVNSKKSLPDPTSLKGELPRRSSISSCGGCGPGNSAPNRVPMCISLELTSVPHQKCA
jgi:hypothetical protein